MIIEIPKSCGNCECGKTWDMSIDDLITKCYITGYEQDWCDFPRRADGTYRMSGCPLPNVSIDKFNKAKRNLVKEDKRIKTNMKILLMRGRGKTKLIQKRNQSRLNRILKAMHKIKISR